MRCITLIVLIALSGTSARAQSEPPRDTNVVLRVSIVGDQRQFRVGETIPIQLSFSAAVRDRYQVDMATYGGSGRTEHEHFSVSPSDGAVDPLANRGGSIGGGPTGFKVLSPEPWTIQLNVNEWVRFTRPGEFQLDIVSHRVGVKNPASVMGTSSVTVVANPITLTIVPATAAWQKATLDGAVAMLNQPAPARPPVEAYYLSLTQALNTLRFLGSPDAIRELANRLRGSPIGNGDAICVLGLISAPEPAVAREALETALVDPDRAIGSQFLYALQTVSADPKARAANGQQDRQRVLEKLVAALSKKRGDALSISLTTAVNEAWNGTPLPSSTTDALVQQLIAMFDSLPPEQQSTLLGDRWDKVADRAMLPILRRHAVAFDDRLNPNSPSGQAALHVGASALQHWYELDPAGARPAIINEITRPSLRHDARVLGLLPDKTLPEVDSILAEHFAASDGFPQSAYIASLIARYATDAILPAVLAKLDPLLGKWACAVQGPILAYTLRVRPSLARPRIERALAARGNGFSGCYQQLLSSISDLYYDPILEDLAVHGLDDPDPRVIGSSATLLGRFGSPRVESVLLQRYMSWSEKWAGREAELNPALADRGPQSDEIGVGSYLLEALTTGKSWLTDGSKLQSLLTLTKGARLRRTLDDDLRIWNSSLLAITVNQPRGSLPFDARVAQYKLSSMEALEEKLGQFSVGTRFALTVSGPDSPAGRTRDAGLRTFLSDHGMIVVAAR
jgi:hypothetical protein